MRSVLGRWCLLVALAIGVVAMHHAPFDHGCCAGSAQPVAPSTASSSHHRAFDDADRPLAVVGGFETAAFSASLVAAEVKTGTGHGQWSHLCLAILPGAAAFLAWLVLLATGPPVSTSKRWGGRVGSPRLRPPPPVLRRLAVLCVLRL